MDIFHFSHKQETTMVITESTKPHVAILPTPGLGHIIPLLEFSKRLVITHGFHVSFIVITTNESSAAQDQILRSPLPPGLHILELPSVDVFAITTDDMPLFTRLCVIIEESLKSLKSLLIELHKLKVLIIDLFTTQAFEVCQELSIPVYSFFTSPIAVLTLSLYLPTMDREVDGEFADLGKLVQVPGCTPILTDDLFDQIKNRKADQYRWFLLHVSRLPLAAGIFVNSWYDIEPVGFKAITTNEFFKQIPTPPVHLVGPLVRPEEPLSSSYIDCLAWLDKQPPDSVLFVALGSGGTLTSVQLSELAWGLELSQQRFIMVTRKPSDSSVASFFTTGSDLYDPKAYLPEGFLQRTEDRGLVVPSWAPQVTVLKHSSTGGFLSHCGWNSALESLAYGVPMITWPLYAEQKMNATLLAEEIGVAMKPRVRVGEGQSIIGREEIERVVKLVMEGEEGKMMRQRAKELKESAVKAWDINGSSYDSLACVANQWKSSQ